MYLVHSLYHKWYDHNKTYEIFRVVRTRPSFKENQERIKHSKDGSSGCGYSEIIRFAKIADTISWQYPKKGKKK